MSHDDDDDDDELALLLRFTNEDFWSEAMHFALNRGCWPGDPEQRDERNIMAAFSCLAPLLPWPSSHQTPFNYFLAGLRAMQLLEDVEESAEDYDLRTETFPPHFFLSVCQEALLLHPTPPNTTLEIAAEETFFRYIGQASQREVFCFFRPLHLPLYEFMFYAGYIFFPNLLELVGA
jgi:hypothetical protein